MGVKDMTAHEAHALARPYLCSVEGNVQGKDGG